LDPCALTNPAWSAGQCPGRPRSNRRTGAACGARPPPELRHLPRHPQGQPALVVRLRARGTAHPPQAVNYVVRLAGVGVPPVRIGQHPLAHRLAAPLGRRCAQSRPGFPPRCGTRNSSPQRASLRYSNRTSRAGMVRPSVPGMACRSFWRRCRNVCGAWNLGQRI
jgi:hypothetical protein